MYRGILPTSLLLVCALGISGCVVVVGDTGAETQWASTWSEDLEVESASNSQLAQNVSKALSADPLLKAEDISVSARKGVVSLHGRVSSVDALQQAVSVASEVPDVESVVSRLSVEVSKQ